MTKEKKLDKRILELQDKDFSIKEIVKIVKTAMEDADLTFVEKEQAVKENQYGKQVTFEFEGDDDLDEFATINFFIKITFKNISEIKKNNKTFDHGGVQIIMIPKVIYDYKNNWATSKFSEFLFEVYLNYFKKDNFEKKYLKPTQEKVDAIYSSVKKLLDLYQ